MAGSLLAELIGDLDPRSWEGEPRAAGAHSPYDACWLRIGDAPQLADVSVTPVPDGGAIAFAVRLRVRERPDGNERQKRYDAFFAQIVRSIGRADSAFDAIDTVLALTLAAFEVPAGLAIASNGNGPDAVHNGRTPEPLARALLEYFASDTLPPDSAIVLRAGAEDGAPLSSALRRSDFRCAMAVRHAAHDAAFAIAVLSRQSGRFGKTEETIAENIAAQLARAIAR